MYGRHGGQHRGPGQPGDGGPGGYRFQELKTSQQTHMGLGPNSGTYFSLDVLVSSKEPGLHQLGCFV